MANVKRLIDADDVWQIAQRIYSDPVILLSIRTVLENALMEAAREKLPPFECTVNEPTADAVEVDTVIEMFEYMMGDCPCNFSPVDEWLAEQCELQEECPNPADKRGCWKQFIKHFCEKMGGDGNG